MNPFCRIYYRVPFSETDAMGIVHHSNHVRYMERGRVELLRLAGQDYLSMTKQGLHFPVTEISVKYRRPILFDDIILLETHVASATRTRLRFSYRAYRVPELLPAAIHAEQAKGELLFSGSSHHCCLNDKGRPVEIEAGIFSALKALETGEDA